MTDAQLLVTIACIALATALTRFAPFLLFSGRPLSPFVRFLQRALPPAVIGLLVVYCLKGVSLAAAPHGAPEGIAIAVIAALHLWRRNTLLSIGGGTLAYMLLVQFVFV